MTINIDFIRRTDWNAEPPARPIPQVTHTHLEVHHGATSTGGAKRNPAATLRRYQQGHLAKGWSDLFYNLALSPGNVLYEGRGVGLKSVGTALTIVMMGDYSREPPSQEMLNTIATLARGTPRGIQGIDWHAKRGVGTKFASACPGSAAIEKILELKLQAAAKPPVARVGKEIKMMSFYEAWKVVDQTYKDAWNEPGDFKGLIFWTKVLMQEGHGGYTRLLNGLNEIK